MITPYSTEDSMQCFVLQIKGYLEWWRDPSAFKTSCGSTTSIPSVCDQLKHIANIHSTTLIPIKLNLQPSS